MTDRRTGVQRKIVEFLQATPNEVVSMAAITHYVYGDVSEAHCKCVSVAMFALKNKHPNIASVHGYKWGER